MRIRNSVIASATMLATLLFLHLAGRAEKIQTSRPLSSFPLTIGQWTGETSRFKTEIYDILGVDDSFLGYYNSSDGRQIQLYIGFYQSQREGDLIHSPKNCMPGSGWNIVRSSVETISSLDPPDGDARAIKLVLAKGQSRQVVLYWFQSRGRIIASEYMQKIYLVIDSIFRHRTDGSFVRLIMPVTGGDEEAAVSSLKGFARDLMPVLGNFLPA